MLTQPLSQLSPSTLPHHIRHQPLVPGCVLAHHHHRFPHLRLRAQHRLDLARLDAETHASSPGRPAAPETQGCRPPATAPGPPCDTAAPAPVAERIRHELLRRQLRTDADNLAPARRRRYTAHRAPPPAPAAGARPAHTPACWLIGRPIGTVCSMRGVRRHRVAAGEGGVLGRTVAVDQTRPASKHPQHPPHVRHRQRLTAGQQLPHPAQAVELRCRPSG